MKKFLINFKSVVQFFVSIIASREFAFVYCVFGTIAQTAHTYYLLDGISSLDGWWKITQSVLLSFFISSSLLYFTAISDSNDKTPAGKRVINAVTLFMWLEIIINLYYYSRHIVIESDKPDYYQLGFGVLIACIIPITIKLYSSQIRAKEWLDLEDKPKVDENQLSEVFDNINIIADRTNTLTDKVDELTMKMEELPVDNDLGTNPKEYINNIVETAMNNNIGKINNEIKNSFEKHSELTLKQHENKIKMMLNQNNLSNK